MKTESQAPWQYSPVTLQDMMARREQRALTQRQLISRHGCPVLSFTMNIAGPIKRSALIDWGFALALQRISRALKGAGKEIAEEVLVLESTGCEMLCACYADASELKRLAVILELQDAFGRLMDADVLDVNGQKISRDDLGIPPRRCLLCDAPAFLCSRARRHPLNELTEATEALLRNALIEDFADRTGHNASQSLIVEAFTTPKPGLVDMDNSGAHDDMDFSTMMISALALRGYFSACAREGAARAVPMPAVVMPHLRTLGLQAEQTMLNATGGVNTHKGAIYGLGILCGAAGMLRRSGAALTADALLTTAGCIASDETRQLSRLAQEGKCTAGVRQYIVYGIQGARGQAARGFPAVREALSVYQACLDGGMGSTEAAVRTLIHLMATVEDTNVIHRAGWQRSQQLMREAGDMISQGFTLEDVRALDKQLTEEGISPGGCADLLAFTEFTLLMVREEAARNSMMDVFASRQ